MAPLNTRMLSYVVQAISDLRESIGSNVQNIIEYVRNSSQSSNQPNQPRNITTQVRLAIRQGIDRGILQTRGGRILLALGQAKKTGGLDQKKAESHSNVAHKAKKLPAVAEAKKTKPQKPPRKRSRSKNRRRLKGRKRKRNSSSDSHNPPAKRRATYKSRRVAKTEHASSSLDKIETPSSIPSSSNNSMQRLEHIRRLSSNEDGDDASSMVDDDSVSNESVLYIPRTRRRRRHRSGEYCGPVLRKRPSRFRQGFGRNYARLGEEVSRTAKKQKPNRKTTRESYPSYVSADVDLCSDDEINSPESAEPTIQTKYVNPNFSATETDVPKSDDTTPDCPFRGAECDNPDCLCNINQEVMDQSQSERKPSCQQCQHHTHAAPNVNPSGTPIIEQPKSDQPSTSQEEDGCQHHCDQIRKTSPVCQIDDDDNDSGCDDNVGK